MFVHLCLNAAEAFTSQCTKSECNSTVQQANETEINGKEKLWHSQYNMHRFSLSLDVRFERCYLSEITWLSFLWIQFLHIRAPHTHTHTHIHVGMKAGRSLHCPQALSTDQLGVYLYPSDGEGRGRSEKNDTSSSRNRMAPQGRKALAASLSSLLLTQESLANTRIIKGWPVPCLLHTSSLHIYGISLLDPLCPQILYVLRVSTLTSTHFFFAPHTKCHPLLSLLILPLTLLCSSSCTQSIFPGIKPTAASSDVSRFEWKLKKKKKIYIQDIFRFRRILQ